METDYQLFVKKVNNYWKRRPLEETVFHLFWKIRKLELFLMDKQIKKVKKDIVKGDKKKAIKDTDKLMKMDKKFDKKIEKAKKVMKKGKC